MDYINNLFNKTIDMATRMANEGVNNIGGNAKTYLKKNVNPIIVNKALNSPVGKVATKVSRYVPAAQGGYELAFGSSTPNRVLGGLQLLGAGMSRVADPRISIPGNILQYAPMFLYGVLGRKGKPTIDLSKGNGLPWTNADYEMADINLENTRNENIPPSNTTPGYRSDGKPLQNNQTIIANKQIIPQQIEKQIQNIQNKYNPSDVINMYKQQIQEANAPQIEAIGNLINNYPQLVNQAKRNQSYYNSLANLTGDNNWQNLGQLDNPLTQETDRIKLIEALQQAKLGNQDKINELIGGTAIMKQLGLPEEAAFANKDILNAWIKDLQTARVLEGRKYAANLGYQGKVDAANIMVDGLLKRQLSANGGNLQRAIVSTMGNISAMGGDPNIVLDYLQTQKIITPQKRAGLNTSGTGLAGTPSAQSYLDIARGNSNR